MDEQNPVRCEAGIVEETTWQLALSGMLSLPDHPIHGERYAAHPNGAGQWHCDTKILLPEIIYTMSIAMPVRSDDQRVMSWAVTVAKEAGAWAVEKAAAQRRFLPPEVCSREQQESIHAAPLDFDTFAGIVLLSLVMTTLGLLCNSLCRQTPAQRKLRRDWAAQDVAYQAHLSRQVSDGRMGRAPRIAPPARSDSPK